MRAWHWKKKSFVCFTLRLAKEETLHVRMFTTGTILEEGVVHFTSLNYRKAGHFLDLLRCHRADWSSHTPSRKFEPF